jgi:predicted phosphodiesterase
VKYLIVSDTHANLEALEAVRTAADYDRLLFLGDAVDYGPDPEAVVDILREEAKAKGALVQGNHDEGVATPPGDFDDAWWSPVAVDTMRYSQSRLSREQVAFLGALPKTAEVDLGAGGRALLCHGVPSSNREYLWSHLPDNTVRGLLGKDADGFAYLFVGHTHQPFDRKVGGLRIANPGSTGQPRDGDPRAGYAVFDTAEGALTFHRVKYDAEKTASKIRERGMPHAARLCGILLLGGG